MKTQIERRFLDRKESYGSRATVKSCFVTGAPGRAKRLHLPVDAFTLWSKWRRTRLVVLTACGVALSDARPCDEVPEGMEGCDLCFLADFVKPSVYRLLGHDGELLYIGCTTNLVVRLLGHRSMAYWPRVAVVDYEEYEDHETALAAEAFAISFFQPPLNTDLTERAARVGRRSLARGAA